MFDHTNAEGRRYATKGEFKAYYRMYRNVVDLEEGETWAEWFETYFESLLETGEARKVGRGYQVYA